MADSKDISFVPSLKTDKYSKAIKKAESDLAQASLNVDKASKGAAKLQFGKHTSTLEDGSSVSSRGFYKDTTIKGEGLRYEKGTGSNRNIVGQLKSKTLMKPWNDIDKDQSMYDEDAGNEVNAKNRQVNKTIFREDISKAISSSRIGFDRKQGNLARANIKKHDAEAQKQLNERLKAHTENINTYEKLKYGADKQNLEFKGDDSYIKQQKKEMKKEKAQYKKQKKEYAKKAYKDNGLKKFSMGNVAKSAVKGFMPEMEIVDSIKSVISGFKGAFKIISAIGSFFSFIINTILLISTPILIAIVVVCSIGLFFTFSTSDETNNYLEATHITSKYETLMKDFADNYFNAIKTNKYAKATNKYDEIVLDTEDPYYNYEQNKLSAFLNAYLGEEINNSNYAEELCTHFYNSCFKITERYEKVEYQEKVWDYVTHEYTYETKTKTVLHLNWVQSKSLDDWIEEQWSKQNVYYLDYDEELAREQYKNYLDPQGINQILASPFESGSANVTSEYGCRIDPINGGYNCNHHGVDYGATANTPLHALADGGIVQEVKWDDGGGNMLAVLYTVGDEKYLVRYAHLNSINVSAGDTVNKSDVIAYSGNTGAWTTGPHLHLEVYLGDKVKSDKQINPLFIVAN